VLLLDRREVGEVQTSACGTPLWVPQALGVEASVLQVHRKAVVHAPTGTTIYDLGDMPYCTFDYRRFCRGLLDQTGAVFLRTAVTGLRDGAVETEAGRFEPPYFWAAPDEARHIVSWIFPVGEASRVGVGSYAGTSKLRQPLERFMGDLGLAPGRYHGTYFPSGLGAPTVGTVFVAGDAAGHCLPLTAEGIRPALYFGDQCGRVAQDVLEGQTTLEQGLAEYRRFVLRHRWVYTWLRWSQWIVQRVPGAWLGTMAGLARRAQRWWWPRYANFGRLEPAGEGTFSRGSASPWPGAE
jgi:hypothetical protein